MLEAAVTVALDAGIAGLTFRAVAGRLGIPDRTVVYYFPDKETLVVSVVQVLATRLQGTLEQAFGSEPRTRVELMRQAWPLLATPGADPIFALFFEMIGLAAAGQELYVRLVRAQVDGWITWLAQRCEGADEATRIREAAAVVAQIDGLILLRQVHGPQMAEQAFLEIVGGP